MRAKLLIMAAACAMMLAGCDVKDPIYDTPHPGHGTITLTTDWTATNIAATPASGCAVRVGACSETLMGVSKTLDYLFDPGDYTIYAHNTTDGISVSGTTATADYAGTPGWFYTGVRAVAVAGDTDHEFIVNMAQQVRELTLVIEPAGGIIERIATITGTLWGVAGTLDFSAGTHGAPSTVGLAFTKGTDGKWTATVHLLGVAGAEQKLAGTIAFTDGSPANLPLDSNLGAALANFNADKKTPLTLGGQVAETPAGAGFTATITGWTPINGGSGTAN